MDKNYQPYEESASEEATITSPQVPMRLLGSRTSPGALRPARLRRIPRDGTPPPDGDGEPPPPPPPAVSVPDLGLQFSPCLPDNLRNTLIGAIREAIDPNADVRAACLQGTERVGIWLRASTGDEDSQARERGLQRLNVIAASESAAFFVNGALIRARAQDAWDRAPKRLNGDGQADPDGPIHLTGFSLSFESPHRVVTRITGFDERPWPDVDFTLTTTDTLSVSGQEVQCLTNMNLDVDSSWINFLTGIFLVLGIISWPFLIPAGIFLTESIIIASLDAPDPNAGAGCAAARLIPKEILVPGGLKVVVFYRRVEVGPGGIFAGGAYLPVPRSPEVTIQGINQISIVEGTESITRSYTIRTAEMLAPLGVQWTADGTVLSPAASTTSVRFDLTGAEAGDVLTKRVAVTVTDRDNLVARAELIVRIHITIEDEGIPPVCRVKPWLPQCSEPMRVALGRRPPKA